MTTILFTILLYLVSENVVAKGCNGIECHKNWKLVNEKNCGLTFTDRIIGGETAGLGSHPWVARIGYTGGLVGSPLQYRCGGSVINKNYVLTAAHCVRNLPPGFRIGGIRIGEYDDSATEDCNDGVCADPVQDFEIESIQYHGKFVGRYFLNDVALIRVKGTIKYSDWVKPICLPTTALTVEDVKGRMAEVVGWGITDMGRMQVATILQQVSVPLVDMARCQEAYPSYNATEKRQVCAGGVEERDSCGGDSGGPLTLVSDAEGMPRTYLYGLVSYGATVCGGKEPAVYTRVSYYLPWVLDHMRK